METNRLIIRRLSADDWYDLYEYLSQEDVIKYEPYGVFNEEECKQEAIRRSQNEAFWAVCLKENGKLIGNIYFQQQEPKEFLTWEIGYVFNSAYYGRGYATEASRRIMQYGFEQAGAHRIIAKCNPENISSWRLMERLQMRKEGHFRKPAFFSSSDKGTPLWHDAYLYSILDEEFLLNRSKNIVLLEDKLTSEDFCNLQESVGFGRPNLQQIEKAINNSIYCISANIEGEVVGMGRLVGDGARIFYLQDVFINPEYQGKGIGKLIVQKLLEYIKKNGMKDTKITVGLMAAKGKEEFYKKFGFRVRPNEKEGSGMMINIEI